VQHVMRGRQQPAGSKSGGQEDGANDEAHGIQGEPDVRRLYDRSVNFDLVRILQASADRRSPLCVRACRTA
jgi:hypothetical protein